MTEEEMLEKIEKCNILVITYTGTVHLLDETEFNVWVKNGNINVGYYVLDIKILSAKKAVKELVLKEIKPYKGK